MEFSSYSSADEASIRAEIAVQRMLGDAIEATSSQILLMSSPKITVLSRFFNENVRLVSGMCSRCHRESTDIRIIAVNRRFLRQVEQRKRAYGGSEDIVTCGHQRELESENESDACVVCFRPSNNLFQYEENNKQNTSEEQTNVDSKKEAFIINEDVYTTEMKHIENRRAEEVNLCLKSFKGNEVKNTIDDCDLSLSLTSQINKSSCESPKLYYSKYFVNNLHKASKIEGETKVEVEIQEETFLNFVPAWQPPKSPHNLIEENLYADPWALLVATIFLNKTSCATARPYIEWFLSDFHNPFEVLNHDPTDLEKYFMAIGLKKRAHHVWRMSHDFVHKEWKDVNELHGIGSYGRDAFNMFCLGRMHIEPKDRFLRIYKGWFDMLEKNRKDTCLTEETNEEESEGSGFGCSPQNGDVTVFQ